MQSPVIKWKGTEGILLMLPQVTPTLPGAQAGVNPNALGATTLFFIPVLAAATVAAWSPDVRRVLASLTLRRATAFRVATFVSLLALLGFGGALVLSQSRSAFLAAAVAASFLFLLNRPRASRLLGIGVLAAIVGIDLYLDAPGTAPGSGAYIRGSLTGSLGDLESSGPITLSTRAGIWSRALRSIHDSPIVGIGLSGFREAVKLPYPGYATADSVPHALNTFLQTALDTGVPGLVAYVAILIVTTTMGWQVMQRGTTADRALALGLWGNLLAVHIFGLFDAIAIGAKVGFFMWWSLGLMATLHRRVTVGSLVRQPRVAAAPVA
jgi:putative inorganic carbon (HCO3(-)) transporter